MKPVATGMTDLPSDVQKHIVKLLATTYCAADFVRAMASCKEWKDFAEDTEILKSIKFDSVYRFNEKFWRRNGFLVKCANAGNRIACDVIAWKRQFELRPEIIGKALEYPPQPRNELRRTDSMCFSHNIL